MYQNLISCVENREIVSIFCDDSNPSTFLTGRVLNVTEDELLLCHISPDGYYDGFIWIPTRYLFRVNIGGKYERKIQTLYQFRKQSHPTVPIKDCLQNSLLSFCLTRNLIVSVELESTTLRGQLVHFDKDIVSLSLLDDYGLPNGTSHVLNEQIISIAVDTSHEQNLRILVLEKTKSQATDLYTE